MIFSRMPKNFDRDRSIQLGSTFKRLIKNKIYSWGVVAQFFYVGAQIGVWSFTIRIVMQELGINEQSAASVYLLSIICFSISRFIFTWLMRYIRPSRLLIIAAIADIVCTAAVILGGGSGMFLIVMLVGVSVFMSLMFPTIYGIALDGLGEDAKIGASGLIMAILGGALLTPLQGLVSDLAGINIAYSVPLICFVVVMAYGIMAQKVGK
jgi:FHS family L-fucose permease-like MFS transporter